MAADDRLGTGEWAVLEPSESTPPWVPKGALVHLEARAGDGSRCVVLYSDAGEAEVRIAAVTSRELVPVEPPTWADPRNRGH